MPNANRICKNYFLVGRNGRGSIWSIWITPVLSGANNIYFAGSGYLRDKANEFGFIFHLSFHKDGRAHIKEGNTKIHPFSVTDANNFPICSVYTHIDDLIVPMVIPNNVVGDKIPIDIDKIPNPHSFKWGELFFAHFETPRASAFLQKFQSAEYDFNVIDRIPIGQNREILVVFRFIESTVTTGAQPDESKLVDLDHTNRLTIWGYRDAQSKHVAIHDLSPDLGRIKSVYK